MSTDSKTFKRLFGQVATARGFDGAFGGWFAASPECLVVLGLQHSQYAREVHVNLKVYVHGVFGVVAHQPSKALVSTQLGNAFCRASPGKLTGTAMDLDAPLSDEERLTELGRIFEDIVDPIRVNAATRAGLRELRARGQIFVTPGAVRAMGWE